MTRDSSGFQYEKSEGTMSSNIGLNEFYHVVVRRGAVLRNSHAVVRKPFVWEIRHKETTQLLGSSAEPFANMEEAHRLGLVALARLSN
jgi:hypothetical protein